VDIDIKQADEKDSGNSRRLPRDLRFRERLFPGAERLVFNTGNRGFVPVPIILRKLLRFLTSPEVRVLLYLYLRSSRFGICYPATEEIVIDLGLTSKKNLLPHIAGLEEKHFISVRTSGSRTFYLVHDPRVAAQTMLDAGMLSEDDVEEINDLLLDLGQTIIRKNANRGQLGEEIS
jgi:hypothetical protein